MKLTFIFVLFSFLAFGQLPKFEVIQSNAIEAIEVWNHQLPPMILSMPNDSNSIQTTTDTTVFLLQTWYFNQKGLPDSVVSFFEGDRFSSRFQFNDRNQLIEKASYKNGKETFRDLVTPHSDGTLEFQKWLHRKLSARVITNADSTVVRTENNDAYGKTTYFIANSDSLSFAKITYKNDKLLSERTERWTTVDGKPDSMYITFQQFERVTRRNGNEKSYQHQFKVHPDGTLIPTSKVSPPQINFYLRQQKCTFIYDELSQVFTNDFLIDRTEDHTTQTYTRVYPRSFLSYTYLRHTSPGSE